eukprot:CAMPEP_0117655314 /NCGR_PEP_ID=MMETSP0804-20121206/4214_1 /TAXON_ID=1074897 /ORGANISM="Tetraselmis astigmatica, Strain CCMP880" /LENGTH=274 /DNA_ID=CAMNT_0005461659 /DNA_START=340 /DNA_END=1164 /DNA_ORIENTATION=+
MLGADAEKLLSDDTLLLLVISALFVSLNLGLRIPPLSDFLLRLLRKDPASLGKHHRRSYVHGAAHRITSHIHNTLAVPLGIVVLMDPSLHSNPLYGTSQLGGMLALLSAGYFLHDLIIVTLFVSEAGIGFFLHGFFCSGLYMYGYFMHELHFFAAAFILWEMSTPFVQLRWFLVEMGLKETKLYVGNGIVMMVVFFIARLVIGSYFSWVFWIAAMEELRSPNPEGFQPGFIYFALAANVILNSLNFFWFSKMVRGAAQLVVQTTKANGERKKAA